HWVIFKFQVRACSCCDDGMPARMHGKDPLAVIPEIANLERMRYDEQHREMEMMRLQEVKLTTKAEQKLLEVKGELHRYKCMNHVDRSLHPYLAMSWAALATLLAAFHAYRTSPLSLLPILSLSHLISRHSLIDLLIHHRIDHLKRFQQQGGGGGTVYEAGVRLATMPLTAVHGPLLFPEATQLNGCSCGRFRLDCFPCFHILKLARSSGDDEEAQEALPVVVQATPREARSVRSMHGIRSRKQLIYEIEI
ncbi:unnamed protein product, partial [Chrysoparadoxa australica]